MTFRRLLPVIALSLSMPALAANERGFLRVDGVQGPSTADAAHHHWFDMPASELSVDATEGLQCTVIADAVAKHVAPLLVGLAGDTVAEVEIELTNFKGQVYSEARLFDVRLEKVTSSSTKGVHVETLQMKPATIQFRVKELEPSGQLGPGTATTVTCGGGRT